MLECVWIVNIGHDRSSPSPSGKRSKGSLGSLNMITGKKHEQGKAKEPLANGAYNKSGESASDGSSECMESAGVDAALIVQPINHKFDHSYVSSVLKKYPSKFIGCCLANPGEDGTGIQKLEDLVLKDGFRALRFNPYLWPDGQLMTNEIGRKLFAKASELGVLVGFMCMKGLNRHISEIESLCSDYPCTTVLLDHLAFCKPPTCDEESAALSNLVKLSRFSQVYVKFSALFRVSRETFPYQDLSTLLSQVVSSFGVHRVMWEVTSHSLCLNVVTKKPKKQFVRLPNGCPCHPRSSSSSWAGLWHSFSRDVGIPLERYI